MLQLLCLLASAFAGACLIGYGLHNVVRALRVERWHQTEAVILERQVRTTPVLIKQWHTAYYPFVRFRYETAAGTKESSHFSVGPKDYRSFDRLDVDQELSAYQVGSRAVALVCPSDPTLAVLRASVSKATMSHYLAVLASGVMILLSCALLLLFEGRMSLQ